MPNPTTEQFDALDVAVQNILAAKDTLKALDQDRDASFGAAQEAQTRYDDAEAAFQAGSAELDLAGEDLKLALAALKGESVPFVPPEPAPNPTE